MNLQNTGMICLKFHLVHVCLGSEFKVLWRFEWHFQNQDNEQPWYDKGDFLFFVCIYLCLFQKWFKTAYIGT